MLGGGVGATKRPGAQGDEPVRAVEPRSGKSSRDIGVDIRTVTAADVEACADVMYRALKGIADRHAFLPDFPSVDAAAQLAHFLISHPSVFGVVAERDGRVVASSFLDERDPIRGLGPTSVDPVLQGRGVGRRLVNAVLERGGGARGIRLVQDAFNRQSMSLHASLGFAVREPIALLEGKPKSLHSRASEVRPLAASDVRACAALCRRVHGFERANELRDALKVFSPFVAVREGRVAAYTTTMTLWPVGHGVAESEDDMQELILGVGAGSYEPLALLLPTRQAGLFRWCLSEGLRVVKPLTLMTLGEYQEPRGAHFPSAFC